MSSNRDVTKKAEEKRVRSPAYPGLSLEKAVQRAGELFRARRTKTISVGHLLRLWRFGENTGMGGVSIAAIKQYGMMRETRLKGGVIRLFELTSLAVEILDEVNFNDDVRLEAKKHAALSPAIFREMWDNWGGDLPPSPEIRSFLKDRRYNPERIPQLILNYKETLGYAGLLESRASAANMRREGHLRHKNTEILDLAIPLIGGGIAEFRIPIPLTEENFEMLTTMLQTMKPAIVNESKQ